MKSTIPLSILFISIFLTSCVNQNKKIAANIMPTTNACTKLSLLKDAYYDDFQSVKEIKMGARSSNVWRAKHQLFGENCQVFSWGGDQHTYSCRLTGLDEETAKHYYRNAKDTTQQCLGVTWQLTENKRVNDEGIKARFDDASNPDEKVSFSTHLIPSSGIFSTSWSLYYYVGNNKEPSHSSH